MKPASTKGCPGWDRGYERQCLPPGEAVPDTGCKKEKSELCLSSRARIYTIHVVQESQLKKSAYIIRKTRGNKFWLGCGEKGTLVHCWWECKLVQPLWKTVWRLLKKLKTE